MLKDFLNMERISWRSIHMHAHKLTHLVHHKVLNINSFEFFSQESILGYYKRLIQMRKRSDVIQHGTFEHVLKGHKV